MLASGESTHAILSSMGALTDLWSSEKGVVAVLLLIGATVLTALGRIDAAAWRDYTTWIFGVYAGTKTVTTVGVAIAKSKAPAEPESSEP